MATILLKLLALFFSLIILILGMLIRKKVGTWLFPSCIFSLSWFVFTFIPLAFLLTVPANPWAIGFIAVVVALFASSSLLFDWRFAYQENKKNTIRRGNMYGSRIIKNTFLSLTIIAVLFAVMNLYVRGFGLSRESGEMITNAREYSMMRNAGVIEQNIYGQFGLAFTYVAASLGGLLLPATTKATRQQMIIILSLIPSLFIMITQSSKGALYLSMALFLGGMIAGSLSLGITEFALKRIIKPLAIYLVIIMFFVGVSFLARGIDLTGNVESITAGLNSYFLSYLFGHLYAYADWFSYVTNSDSSIPYSDQTYSYGFYTFMAIFRLLGDSRFVPLGVFEEYYVHEDILTTNIYTIFRSLITDFGLLGCLVFAVCFGLIAHFAFYKMLTTGKSAISVAFFIFLVGSIIHSFLGSVFIYNVYYLCFAMLWCILFLNRLSLSRKEIVSPRISQVDLTSKKGFQNVVG